MDARPPAPRPREAIAEAPRTSPEPPVPTPAAPAQRESAPATDTSAPPACVAFAGLGVDQAQELAARIGKVGGGLKLNESRSEQPSSWWVYIPSPGSKDGADRKAAEVRKLGVDDLYIVPDAGPNQFAISLGLFKSEVAANRQLEVLRAKGVRSAQIATRGSALVRLEVDNAQGLLAPGMLVDVTLEGPERLSLTVDANALVDLGRSPHVFIAQGNGRFEIREVTTGWQDADRIEILSGVREGERVVTAGAFLLDSETRLRNAPVPE